jgi:hypothetical protein
MGSARGPCPGKAPKKLRIYDPFYCAGSVVKHLTELGFPQVYNKCEDCGSQIGMAPPATSIEYIKLHKRP